VCNWAFPFPLKLRNDAVVTEHIPRALEDRRVLEVVTTDGALLYFELLDGCRHSSGLSFALRLADHREELGY
jgi:hypothetical protein